MWIVLVVLIHQYINKKLIIVKLKQLIKRNQQLIKSLLLDNVFLNVKITNKFNTHYLYILENDNDSEIKIKFIFAL